MGIEQELRLEALRIAMTVYMRDNNKLTLIEIADSIFKYIKKGEK